jgi:uncharacterized protein
VVELFLRNFIQLFLVILWLMVLGRALLSWVDPTGRNQISAFLIQTTEPILAPVRRLLPQSSMIDFSPLIVLLVLGALMRAFWVLSPHEVRFAVRLTPRAGSDAVDGVIEGALKVRVAAPPVEGAANQALLRLLAEVLGIARRDVRLVAGAAGRQKLVVVEGVAPEDLVARWPGLRV